MKGRFCIAKTSATGQEDFISITVMDEERNRTIRIRISKLQFTEALFGVMDAPCEITRNTWSAE